MEDLRYLGGLYRPYYFPRRLRHPWFAQRPSLSRVTWLCTGGASRYGLPRLGTRVRHARFIYGLQVSHDDLLPAAPTRGYPSRSRPPLAPHTPISAVGSPAIF